jgi:trehalose-6-phosphate synthase
MRPSDARPFRRPSKGVHVNSTELKAPIAQFAAGARLFVGAGRIDYTKGIPERLMAFDLMLKRHPESVAKPA